MRPVLCLRMCSLLLAPAAFLAAPAQAHDCRGSAHNCGTCEISPGRHVHLCLDPAGPATLAAYGLP